MWVFRDDLRTANVERALGDCRTRWRALLGSALPDHDAATDLLIGVGELESALVDASFGERDSCSSITESLRCLAISCGHLFRASWRREWPERRLLREAAVERAFVFLESAPLPERVELHTPEGYAYYSLYPETYLEAAARFATSRSRGRALCIGLRSIGTGLSAVVSAELEALGWTVRSDTLRPRGDPWDRTPRVDRALRRAWHRWREGYCLVVDEGPGLSGSSLTGTALALEKMGFARQRITLFPSWDPPASQLQSARAKELWPRYRKALVPFEALWIDSRRLHAGPVRDISAGTWRELLFADPGRFPAVQPYHERRKYLGDAPHGPFFKFIGLGFHGRPRFRRAELLADAGLSPAVYGWENGFLRMKYLEGRPLRPQRHPPPRLLQAIGRYLATLRREFGAQSAAPYERHLEMIHRNLGASLTVRRSGCLERFRGLVTTAPAVAIDGRMLPHEWLITEEGYIKTDVTDHHDDHFYPGSDDLAWDVAGCCIEFGFDRKASRWLAQEVSRLTRDPALPLRIPFYAVAYLGYRIAYATLAVRSLGSAPDGVRFRRLLGRYRRQEQTAWAALEAQCRTLAH